MPSLKLPPAPGDAGNAALGLRISRLRIRHMQLLDRIQKHGSLSAAAAGIGVSQPRATNMLREMEDAFGRSLLDRSSRGAVLNASGVVVLERLRIALGSLEAAQVALRGRTQRPTVRIGVLPLVGTDRLCSVVAGLQDDGSLPQLLLRVGTVGELLAMLVAGDVDCVVCGLDTGSQALPAGDRLRMFNLWEESLMVVAAKDNPIIRKRKVSLAELLEHPWLLMAGKSANRQALERMFLRAGLQPPEPQVETESPHIGLSVVSTTRMLALVSESAYWQALDRISQVRVDTQFQPTWINLVTLRDVPVLPFVEELAVRLKDSVQPARERTRRGARAR